MQDLDAKGTNFCAVIHKHVCIITSFPFVESHTQVGEFGKLYSEYCERNDDGIALWQQLAKGEKRLTKFEEVVIQKPFF